MKTFWIFFAVLLMIGAHSFPAQAAEQEATAATYEVNASQSKISAEVGTSGVFGFMGHAHHIQVGSLTGQVSASMESPSVVMRVVSDSLKETGDFSQTDLTTIETKMKQDVLETVRYPEIVFKSTSATVKKLSEGKYQVDLKGELTLHGVTRTISFPASVTVKGTTLHADGAFKIQREDYNLKTDTAGGGTVKVGKEVKISFNIVALTH